MAGMCVGGREHLGLLRHILCTVRVVCSIQRYIRESHHSFRENNGGGGDRVFFAEANFYKCTDCFCKRTVPYEVRAMDVFA